MSIQQTVWSFLRGKGLPEKSCSAVLGNIQAESEFDETKIEVGSGNGFGLCQWTGERRTQLKAYGIDLTHQLNFLWAELSGDVGNTGASLQWMDRSGYLSHSTFMSGNGSITDLTAAMCYCWERPGIARLSVRQQSAQDYFNQFTGTTGTPSANDQQTMTIESTNYEVVSGSQKQGQILYGRRYRVTITDAQGNGVNVSQLRCVFQVKKTIQMEPNFSQITIYNLNAQTENMIMLTSTRVTLEAGYEGDQYGLIFDGDILQTIRDKEDSTTYRLTIIALDSDRAINYDIANYSVLRGQTARTLVDHIVNKAQYPVALGSISSQLDNAPKLTRGKVFFGKSSDYLRQIAESNKCKYYMEDGKLNIINVADLPEGEIFDLSPSSGLIGTPEQSEYGITGKCLLNPKIKVNTLIHIDNSLVRARQIDTTNSSNTVPASSNNASSGTRQTIIAKAAEIVQKCQEGKAIYVLGGRGTNSAGQEMYDCSIFAETCYAAAGITMTAPSGSQYSKCSGSGGFVSTDFNRLRTEGKAGDLLFVGAGGNTHVAIYDGNGGQYAAHSHYPNDTTKDIRHDSTIEGYHFTSWGRPAELANSDNGIAPSANGNTTGTNTVQTSPFRSLDKDGIYRCIACTYSGDTRSDDWSVSFETITQVGGQLPLVTN